MSKVVLHIGTHKTATTTLQDTFYHNADKLAEAGVIYPQLGRRNVTGHHGLVRTWVPLPKVYHLKAGSREMLSRMAHRFGDKDVTLFLSSEEFSHSGTRTGVDFAEVRQLLSAFDEIEVVCTLRTQWQFLQSIYQEVSRRRNPYTPDKIVDPSIETGRWEDVWVDYNLLLDRLLEAFDETEITFLDFETIKSAPGGVVGAFLDRYCPEMKPSQLDAVNDGASNVSATPLATWAAHMVLADRKKPEWLMEIVETSLDMELGKDRKTCLFSAWECQKLNKHFDSRNEVLRKRREPYQPDFRISPVGIDHITHFRDDIPLNAWLRIARRVTHRCFQLEQKLAEQDQELPD